MTMDANALEAVIGLEVHAELKTATKIFCACPTTFGAAPNTQVCPVCMGLPGALPTLNRRVVELAVTAGLALHCRIAQLCRTDRKQYFYPDLPKGYQISQAQSPLCEDGYLTIEGEDGSPLRVGIARIHIEEDAGKLTHTADGTLVDCNRCGVPLIEIVSRPDMHSAREAGAYLRELRAVLAACGVSDGRMQEGSLRCDVNVSVRRRGESTLGVRSEIKNVNSFAFAEKAIDFEIARQKDAVLRGERLVADTRRFDEAGGTTVRMRKKETADDYRYLREANLLPLRIPEAFVEQMRARLPELPSARRARLCEQYGLTRAEAGILVSDKGLADYFETCAHATPYSKTLVNLLLSELLRVCESDPFASPVLPERLAALATLQGERRINSATAKKLLARLCTSDFSPTEVVEREGLAQVTDRDRILSWIGEAMRECPRAVQDYRAGKKAAMRALQGKIMAKSGGRAEPEISEALLCECLEKTEV